LRTGTEMVIPMKSRNGRAGVPAVSTKLLLCRGWQQTATLPSAETKLARPASQGAAAFDAKE
jgi:hypothetical protein